MYTDPLPRLGSKRSCSEGSMGGPLMLQWKVCTCVHVLLLHTMFVLEIPSWSMDVYSVTYTHFVLVMLYTVHHMASHCTPLCTSHFTLYYVILYVTLCIRCTVHPSGVTMNILITGRTSTHHPPQSNGDHFTRSEPKRRHLEEGVPSVSYYIILMSCQVCISCKRHVRFCTYVICSDKPPNRDMQWKVHNNLWYTLLCYSCTFP